MSTIRAVDFAEFLRRFGQNLQKARWLKGRTQEEIAAEGLSYRYYAELERGLRNPTLRTLHDLAELLGVTVADLVNVPGARASSTPLSGVKANPPPKGRRPGKRKR